MLKEFNIKGGEIGCYYDEGNKYTLLLSISNQESIVNFYQKIGFMNKIKQKSLENALKDILKKGRINLRETLDLLEKLREKFGSDKKAIEVINKYTIKIYSKRQFEHFRRREAKVPFEILFNAIKISRNAKILNNLPEYAQTLWRLYNHRSLSPRMNSSTISLATVSGN